MAENNSRGRLVLIGLGLVLLAGIIVTAILRDRIVSTQYRQVTVTGQGRVAYDPDIAIVTLGVQIDKAAQPDAALDQLNAKVNRIISAVKGEGVADEDISTQNYNLNAQYDYKDNISTVSGYNANQQLSIKVRGYDEKPDRLNRVIGAASKAGANQINNLAFDSTRMNDLKQEARIKALQDAQEKSVSLASAVGVSIKNIAGWWENVQQPVPYASYGIGGGDKGAGGDMSAQVPSGSHEVVIEVGVSYNIK
ncbi:MAG: SIMPL domain-containing protein [Bacillota bacterium]